MTTIDFAASTPLTLGIEEEFFLVEEGSPGAMAMRASELLDGDWATIAVPGGWCKAELLRGTIEVATAASAELAQLDVDLRAVRQEVVQRARSAGLGVAALGMHPDLRVSDALVSPTEAHEAIAELFRRVGMLEQQVAHGIHVHVGMPGLADALRVVDAFAAITPLLTALTANSPVVDGHRTPWRSARTHLLQQVLWGGPTPPLLDEVSYTQLHRLHQLENPGEQRFLWEVAPVPALGTVEVRSCDAHRDPAVALGVAALLQSLAAYVLDGGVVERDSPALERHNRWSAMEFGAGARMLVPGRDEPVEVGELVHGLLERVAPHARALGASAWLEAIAAMLAQPPVEAALTAFEDGGVDGLVSAALLH